MLSKLLKYEYRATARFLLPLYLGVLFVIMVNALFLRMGDFFPAFASGDSYSLILALLLIACVLGFLAVVIAGFVTGIQRFYGLLGTRGYLMFSLPVTANQLIASKLICATSWMIGAFLLGCVFLRMMAFPFGEENLVVIAPNSGVALFCHCLALLAMLCCSILFFYFCIALGGQWPQNRLIATILCYFVITFVLQIVLFFAMIALALIALNTPAGVTVSSFFSSLSPYQAISVVACCMTLFFAAACAILWVLTRYYLTKKLNLA